MTGQRLDAIDRRILAELQADGHAGDDHQRDEHQRGGHQDVAALVASAEAWWQEPRHGALPSEPVGSRRITKESVYVLVEPKRRV